MRLYTFCNYYLSSLQQGLQTAHVVAELFNDYKRKQEESQLFDWSLNHKTIVILNGGNCESLKELNTFLNSDSNDFPHTSFNEDEQSLNGALTCVGIVLPEKIYSNAAKMRENRKLRFTLTVDFKYHIVYEYDSNYDGESFTSFEVELIERLNGYRLAA